MSLIPLPRFDWSRKVPATIDPITPHVTGLVLTIAQERNVAEVVDPRDYVYHSIPPGEADWWNYQYRAAERRNQMQQAWVVAEGYVEIGSIEREIDRFFICVTATDLGREALACIRSGCVWDTATRARNLELTERFYGGTQRGLSPASELYDRILATTEADLAPLRARLIEQRIERFYEALDRVTHPKDVLFDVIERLDPEVYRMVRAQAFHQMLKVRTPLHVRRDGLR